MKIWIVKEAEHMPMLTGRGRKMRAGMLADYFAKKECNDVIWWSSTFLHFEKEYYKNEDVNIDLKKNLHLKMIHVNHVYKKNISLSRIRYCKLLAKQFRRKIEDSDKPDLIYCSWPLIELSYECVKYAQKKNIPVVIDIRDMWPDIFAQPFKGIVKKIAEKVIGLIYSKKTQYVMKNADIVIGVVPKCLELAEKYGRTLNKYDRPVYLAYKQNMIDSKFSLKTKENIVEKLNIEEDFCVVYFGSINNRIDNMDILLEAAKANTNKKVKFIVCGTGLEFQKFKNETEQLQNIVFTGLLNSEEIQNIASIAKLGLLSYRNTEDFTDSLPNKFAEYLSYGLPVLTSLTGLSRKIVEKEECGAFFNNAQELNSVINKYYYEDLYLNDQKINALTLYNEKFNADIIYNRLVNELEKYVKEERDDK